MVFSFSSLLVLWLVRLIFMLTEQVAQILDTPLLNFVFSWSPIWSLGSPINNRLFLALLLNLSIDLVLMFMLSLDRWFICSRSWSFQSPNQSSYFVTISALHNSFQSSFHARTKRIELDYHFRWELYYWCTSASIYTLCVLTGGHFHERPP